MASAEGGRGREGLSVVPVTGAAPGPVRRLPVVARGVVAELVGDPAPAVAAPGQAADVHSPPPPRAPTGGGAGEGRAPESLWVAAEKAAGLPAVRTSLRLSVRQQKMAEAARARVRAEMQQWMTDEDAEELVGAGEPPFEGLGGNRSNPVAARVQTYTEMSSAQRSSALKCTRCSGKGYLSCLACAD